jgi:hypothetical protein
LTSDLFFLSPVLLYDGSTSIRSGSSDACGSRHSDSLCDLNVISRNNTLLAILQSSDLPPFVTGRVVENQNFIAETDCDLVLALGHEVEEHDTLLLNVGIPGTCS